MSGERNRKPTDEQVEAAARAIGAWALDTLGLGVPVLLCDETPSDPRGPWDHPTPHAFDVARAVLTAVGPAIAAEAEASGAREADAALTKALGQRDAVAVTAERMTSYARQAEAVLREFAALADDMSDELDMLRAEPGPAALSYANCTAMDLRRIRAILARAEQTGADRG